MLPCTALTRKETLTLDIVVSVTSGVLMISSSEVKGETSQELCFVPVDFGIEKLNITYTSIAIFMLVFRAI